MTMTTIKVSTTTRDRLKALATDAELSLGAYLEQLATRADRARRFQLLEAQIASTPAALMASYSDETASWERTELADAEF